MTRDETDDESLGGLHTQERFAVGRFDARVSLAVVIASIELGGGNEPATAPLPHQESGLRHAAWLRRIVSGHFSLFGEREVVGSVSVRVDVAHREMTTLADEGVEQVTHLRAQWVGQWEKHDDFDGALESSQELPTGDRRREAAASTEIPACERTGGKKIGLHQEQTRREHRHGRP